jgi:hypothetical protein
MSRYTLIEPGNYSKVVFGWDAITASCFLQCFAAEEDDDDSPIIWRSTLSVIELREALVELKLELPGVALRMLEADACGVPFRLVEGDPALWRGSSPSTPCMVLESLLTFARVRWPNGKDGICLAVELEPDIARTGFDFG